MTFFGDCASSAVLIFFCGEAGICTSRVVCPLGPTDFEAWASVWNDGGRFSFAAFRLSDRVPLSTSDPELTAAFRFCCSFLSLILASNACNCSCRVSSSSFSSPSSGWGTAGVLRPIALRLGVVVALFNGDGVGDVLSWYSRILLRPLGELRSASWGERGGHRGSREAAQEISSP